MDYKSKHGCVSLRILNRDFHFFETDFGEKRYAVIDCVDKTSLAEFQNACQTILLTFCFLSGDFYGDEGYYIGFKDKALEAPTFVWYHKLMSSAQGQFSAFTTNAYLGIDPTKIERDEDGFISKEKRKELNAGIVPFPSSIFSRICEFALNNEKVGRSLLLLARNFSSSLEVKIPLQYVCLEAITAAIVTKGNSDLKPINDDKVAGELKRILREESEKFLKEYKISTENEPIQALFKRLESINVPTNTDKLSKPFAQVGFTLGQDEQKVIRLRDTFLHGSIKTFGNREDDFKGLFHITLTLHFLINVLLLKQAGFVGRIINYPKLYETVTEKFTDQQVLRAI